MDTKEQQYIDIYDIRYELSVEEKHRIADVIAEANLTAVNSISKPVMPKKTFYTRFVKRIFDLVVSAVALAVTLPFNAVFAVLTFLDVGRPIFFFQERVGKDGKPFNIVKLRNMTNEKDANGDLLPAAERVTKFGKLMRRTSLDELLNFWSIFKGDMSLIGPRPLPTLYNSRFSDRHKMRNAVKPGLLCPIANGSNHQPTWVEQFENDIWYVENISFMNDVKLALHLVKEVFDRKSSAVRSASARGSFMGYEKDGSDVNSHRIPEKYIQKAGIQLTEK